MHWALLSHVHSALGGLQCVLLQGIYHNSDKFTLRCKDQQRSQNTFSGACLPEDHRCSEVHRCSKCSEVLPYPGSNKTISPPSAIWPLLCFIKHQGKTETFPRIFTIVVWTAWNFELPLVGQTVDTLKKGNWHRQSLLRPYMQNVYLSISLY